MRILVVEDNHKIANSVKKGLNQEAYAVDVAFDGEKGFDLAATEDYDVIVLDLMLPGMNGIEICQKLRDEEGVHTPILILTAKDQLDDKVKGLNTGADDYLVKPFAFRELLARVKALTRRPKKSINSVLRAGDLSLDSVNFKVERKRKEIKLSKREFSLLEYLLRNKRRVVSKEQIINHVWDYDANVLPNTVEVYVGYLRKKIGKPDVIETVRGFGYKIKN